MNHLVQPATYILLEGPVGHSLHQRITLVVKEATCLNSFMVIVFSRLERIMIDVAHRSGLPDLNVYVISEWQRLYGRKGKYQILPQIISLLDYL